jgi:sporulation protein YlmC with PRC-barrel domain
MRRNAHRAPKFQQSDNLRDSGTGHRIRELLEHDRLNEASAYSIVEETRTMLKKLMITTASLALLTSAAIAQTPDQTQPAPTAAAAAKGQVITEQKPDQMLATKFKGTDVIGSNNEKIGDVNDMLFDKDGKILAYVVGVGGFLGIGTKDVALSPMSFQIVPANDKESMKLKLSMTKDELKTAADFKPYKETTTTTGQAPSRDRAPMTPPAQR